MKIAVVLALFFVLCVLFGCMDFSPPLIEVPADLKITFTPRCFMCPTEKQVIIYADGSGEVINSAGLLVKNHPFLLTKAELLDILNTAKSNGFFSMNEKYVNPDIMDGGSTTITIRVDGVTKSVQVINYDYPAFYNISDKISSLTTEKLGLQDFVEDDLLDQCGTALANCPATDTNYECNFTKSICSGYSAD